LTTLRHEPVEIPELPRQMLMLMDGSRDAEALATDIVKLGHAGKIGVREQEGGPAVTDPKRLEELLRALVADNLPKIAKVALLLE